MSESEPSRDHTSFEDVLAEYITRIDRGERIDQEQFIAEHKDVAEELRAYFDDAQAVDRMIESAADDIAGAPTRSDELRPTDEVHYFGDYVLLEEIGRGGMGVVYKARQQSLARTVAVKMIMAGRLASTSDVDRFRREAEAAAKLKHPGIVAVFEVGKHEGRHYFSMDYVEGQSLAEAVRDQALNPQRAAVYMQQIAEAVDYAHQQGTLHRDLKPANVLINQDDHPIVTDFGLAKQVERDADLTLSGQVLGSPSYMSPEQAEGQHARVSPKSDVYSLGATLYELLVGRPPFRGDSPVATLQQVLHTEVVAPRRLNPSIDRDLETICLKCLQKDSAQRYESARALAEDLSRYREGRPIKARPISSTARLWRWGKRNPLVASLIGAVVLSLALGIVVSSSYAVASKRAEQRTRQEAAAREIVRLRRSRDRGDWQSVLQLLATPALADFDDPVQLRLWRVEAFYALNRSQEAFQEIEELASGDMSDKHAGEILLWHGDILRLRRVRRSATLIKQAINTANGLSAADLAYARALLAKTVPESVEFLQKAITEEPFHHRANPLLAMSLLMLGQVEGADARAGVLRSVFPDDPNYPLILAIAATIRNDEVAVERQLGDLREMLDGKLFENFQKVLASVRDLRHRAASGPISALTLMKELLSVWTSSQRLWRPESYDMPAVLCPPDQLARALTGAFRAQMQWSAGRLIQSQKKAAVKTMGEAADVLPIAIFRLLHGNYLLEDGSDLERAAELLVQAAEAPELIPGVRRTAHVAAATANLEVVMRDRESEKGKQAEQTALEQLGKYIALGSLSPENLVPTCTLLMKFDRPLEAHQILERAHAQGLAIRGMASLLAWSHKVQGNYYRALELAQAALQENPDDARARTIQGECRRKLKAALIEAPSSG